MNSLIQFTRHTGIVVRETDCSFVNNPNGWMAIFDDDASKSWDEKIYTRDEVVDGKTIHFVGL